MAGMEVEAKAKFTIDQALKNITKLETRMDKAANKSKGSFNKMGKAVGVMTTALAGAAAGAVALGATLHQAMQTPNLDHLEANLTNALKGSGIAADEFKQKMIDLSHGTLSEADAMRLSIKGLATGFDSSQLEELLGTSVALAKAHGADVNEVFERLVLGTGKMEREFFDEYGIVLGHLDKVTAEYAVSLGKTTDELTEAERKQAFYNDVIAKSSDQVEKFGSDSSNMNAQSMKLWATIKNYWHEFGTSVQGVFEKIAGHLNKFLGNKEQMETFFGPMISGLKEWYNKSRAAVSNVMSAFMILKDSLTPKDTDDKTFLHSLWDIVTDVVGLVGTLSRTLWGTFENIMLKTANPKKGSFFHTLNIVVDKIKWLITKGTSVFSKLTGFLNKRATKGAEVLAAENANIRAEEELNEKLGWQMHREYVKKKKALDKQKIKDKREYYRQLNEIQKEQLQKQLRMFEEFDDNTIKTSLLPGEAESTDATTDTSGGNDKPAPNKTDNSSVDAGKTESDTKLADLRKRLSDEVYDHRTSNYDKEMTDIHEQYEAHKRLAKGNAEALAEIEEWKNMKIAALKYEHNDEIKASEQQLVADIEAIKDVGELGTLDYETDLAELFEYRNRVMAQLEEHYAILLEMEGISEQQRLELKNEWNERRLEADRNYQARSTAILSSGVQADVNNAKSGDKTQKDSKKELYSGMLKLGKDFLGEGAKQSKALFNLNKALNVAEAVMDTHKSAVASYKWASAFGGPPAGAAAAALATAAGMMKVKSIMAQKFGEDNTTTSSSSGGVTTTADNGVSGSTETNLSQSNVETEEARPQMLINITGDVLCDDDYILKLTSMISEAVEEKDVTLVSSTAKYSTD